MLNKYNGAWVLLLSKNDFSLSAGSLPTLRKNISHCLVIWNYMNTMNTTYFRLVIIRLRTLTWKKQPEIKLQRLRKVWIWTFGSLVHQKNFLEVLTLKQNFQKSKAFTGKILSLLIGSFCTHHFICLNIAFWYCSFVWKLFAFNPGAFN